MKITLEEALKILSDLPYALSPEALESDVPESIDAVKAFLTEQQELIDTISEIKIGENYYIEYFNKIIQTRILGISEEETEDNNEVYYKCGTLYGCVLLPKKHIFRTKEQAEANKNKEA